MRLDTINRSNYRVAIIGGGIAGMSAAYALQEKARASGSDVSYILFESTPALGGKIRTDETDGFVVEGGPDSFLAQKPWAAQLAQSLGLEQDLIGTNPNQKKLFVVNHGRLEVMPDGVMLIVPTQFLPFVTSPLISWPGKLRMGMDIFIPGKKDDEDESVGSFIRRRLGSEALDKIAAPLMSGIHVSDPDKQSLLGTFPRFHTIERQHGSLIRGMVAQRRAARAKFAPPIRSGNHTWKNSAFVTLRGGMAQLVQSLEKALTGDVRKNCRVVAVEKRIDAGYQIRTAGGESLDVDAVVLASPAYVSSDLVAGLAPHLSKALSAIHYVSTATVSLAFNQAEFGDPIKGVGFLVPRKENRHISACTMSSIKFSHRAPEGQVLLRCFMGGPWHEQDLDASDEELVATVLAELAELTGLQARPVLSRVYRWPKGNPQYDVGHLDKVKELHGACPPGIFLAGSAYDGVGVPDCIHQGQLVAEKVLAYLPCLAEPLSMKDA